jgi:hypothetical protein
MYDIVTCEYPLPLPEEVRKLGLSPDWSAEEFQTKSFDKLLTNYSIEDDGQMYRTVIDRNLVQDESGELKVEMVEQGIERVEYTGEVKFYTVFLKSEFDYWIEFIALYWKGDLKEMKLSKWEKMDNSDRVEIENLSKKQIEEYEKKQKRPWNKFKRKIFPLVRGILSLVRWPINYLAKLIWRIERWLT